jgi:hypothetical protein
MGGLRKVCKLLISRLDTILANDRQFALTDALAKYLLTCIVEPPGELLTSARARARDRYEKLLRAAAKTITGETENPLMETVNDGN